MRPKTRIVAGALAMAMAGPAGARALGEGTKSASSAPPTKSSGTAAEAAELRNRDLPISPRHGLFGAPGAAQDAGGPSRLGGHAERSTPPSYGEGARLVSGGGESYQPWKSGDRVRSWSAADVRAARVQQAPDLEWAGAVAKGGDPRREPQEPYGVRFSIAQQPKPPR